MVYLQMMLVQRLYLGSQCPIYRASKTRCIRHLALLGIYHGRLWSCLEPTNLKTDSLKDHWDSFFNAMERVNQPLGHVTLWQNSDFSLLKKIKNLLQEVIFSCYINYYKVKSKICAYSNNF